MLVKCFSSILSQRFVVFFLLPSLSRYRLKFSADKVDTMIVQAICKYSTHEIFSVCSSWFFSYYYNYIFYNSRESQVNQNFSRSFKFVFKERGREEGGKEKRWTKPATQACALTGNVNHQLGGMMPNQQSHTCQGE